LKCLEAEETPSTKIDTFVKLTCHITNQTNFLLPGLKDALEEPLTKKNDTLGREAKYPQIAAPQFEKKLLTYNIYVRSSRISQLPYYITVQFMRFEWRADSKMKAKIVKPIEFPMILDVYDLCTPGNN
jgi:ubiquitin carboxyl-terminal hydrolase 14